MRLASRLAAPAAIAALAAALAVPPGTAHAEARDCTHDAAAAQKYARLAAGYLRDAIENDNEESYDSFYWAMDMAYEAAGGYC